MTVRILADDTTGAASAALRAAAVAGLSTAVGTLPDNVRDAQATLLFASARVSPDGPCDDVRKAVAARKGKILEIPVWGDTAAVPAPGKVAALIRARGIAAVHVAGTLGSADPAVAGVPGSGIEAWVECWCGCLFELLAKGEA